MTIFNRRNAALGWLVWMFGKRLGKRKAREAVPSIDSETKRPNKSAVAAGLAAVGGALAVVLRRRRSEGDGGS